MRSHLRFVPKPLLLGLVLFWTAYAQAFSAAKAAGNCDYPLQSNSGSSYTIMSFNVENLFMRAGAHERISATELRPVDLGDRNRPLKKSPVQLMKTAAIIKLQNPDFLVLTEVEDNAADRFNAEYLNGEYEVRCERGNDPRGIEIAILVRKTLGFEIEYRSHKDLTWNDPAEGGRQQPLFARDFPVMILRKPGEKIPSLIITGNHAKSKRDRPGDAESAIWRTAEYEAKAKILRKLKEEFAGVTILSAGDFNTEVRAAAGQGPELKPIVGIMKDAFEVAVQSTPVKDRITHSFFPRGPRAIVHRQQMDTIMVDLAQGAEVRSATVVPYLDARGNPIGLPQSYHERSRQPSDHNAVLMEFSLP